MKERDELLTLEELTAFLKVKNSWVYQRIHAGTLPFPHVKVGNFLRFPLSGINEFIESQVGRSMKDGGTNSINTPE